MTAEEAVERLKFDVVAHCLGASNIKYGGDCEGEDGVNKAIEITIDELENQIEGGNSRMSIEEIITEELKDKNATAECVKAFVRVAVKVDGIEHSDKECAEIFNKVMDNLNGKFNPFEEVNTWK